MCCSPISKGSARPMGWCWKAMSRWFTGEGATDGYHRETRDAPGLAAARQEAGPHHGTRGPEGSLWRSLLPQGAVPGDILYRRHLRGADLPRAYEPSAPPGSGGSPEPCRHRPQARVVLHVPVPIVEVFRRALYPHWHRGDPNHRGGAAAVAALLRPQLGAQGGP